MKHSRKKYGKPQKPWDKERIEREKKIMRTFGLRRKKEIWRTESLLRKFRRNAKTLAARRDIEREKILIQKLARLGLLNENATLDEVLGLSLESLLERRLQTVIFKKGFANSVKQARQMITHGNVMITGRKVVFPSYLVSKDEEEKIQVALAVKVVKK